MNAARSRWAAIGAAVAVSLGAGGVGISQATTDSGDGPVSAFFPIEPCRLADNATIGADTSITLDGTGTTGACELPESVTGLAANVTAVGATQQTNLRFYAADSDVPDTANLNPTPGAPPTPNAVNIPINTNTGQFSVYNRFGTVAVFIDILGYYDDHTHDNRYYTKAEVDDLLANPSADDGNHVNIFELVPRQEYPSFGPVEPPSWYLASVWSHEATDDEECLYGAITLTPGTTVTGATVVYSTREAGVASVQIDAMPNDTRPSSEIPLLDLTGEAAYPASGATARSEITIDFADDHVILDDFNYVVLVCTADDFALFGLEIRTD